MLDKLIIQIDDLRVADITELLLERHAKYPNACRRYSAAAVAEQWDCATADMLPHRIVNASARKNYFRMGAHLLGLGGQTIRIDADASGRRRAPDKI